MKSLVKYGKTHPIIRAKAAALVQKLPQKDYINEIRTIFEFVQNNIRYLHDIDRVETIHYPEQILKQAYGDCDDKAILLASLLGAIGKKTRFVAVGFQPGSFTHVFTDVLVGNNRWLTLEPTEPHPMGWRPPGIVSIFKPPVYN